MVSDLSTPKGRYGKSKVSVVIGGTREEQIFPFPQGSNALVSSWTCKAAVAVSTSCLHI